MQTVACHNSLPPTTSHPFQHTMQPRTTHPTTTHTPSYVRRPCQVHLPLILSSLTTLSPTIPTPEAFPALFAHVTVHVSISTFSSEVALQSTTVLWKPLSETKPRRTKSRKRSTAARRQVCQLIHPRDNKQLSITLPCPMYKKYLEMVTWR
jgi:hypothetical protein